MSELVNEIRERVAAGLASRERAGIEYRGFQMGADELLALCDLVDATLTEAEIDAALEARDAFYWDCERGFYSQHGSDWQRREETRRALEAARNV